MQSFKLSESQSASCPNHLETGDLKGVPVKLRKIGAKKSGKPIPSWRSGNVPPSQATWEKFEYQSLNGRGEMERGVVSAKVAAEGRLGP